MIINDYDALDVVKLCHAALAQDSPETPTFYINQIMNLMFGYLSTDQRKEVERIYLAEKKYLPDVKIELSWSRNERLRRLNTSTKVADELCLL